MYDVLFTVNNSRGSFAYSHCFLNKSKTTPVHISKFSVIPKIDAIKDVKNNYYHFGHFQAPTSDVRDWSEKTSHPFEYNNWVVAHNGVLSNFKRLRSEYDSSGKIQIDSELIPRILNSNLFVSTDSSDNIVEAIKLTLEKIKGTFALWIIHKESGRAFIVRQGSTLFANLNTGSFSSVECKSENWVEVPEGKIYELLFKDQKLKHVGSWTTESPFVFLD